jgi:hypothetical protein
LNGGRAFIHYFVHQRNAREARGDPYWYQRTAIQVAELKYENGSLSVDREAKVRARLRAPRD